MDYSNDKYAPAEKDLLHIDIDGEPCCEEWNYWSVVGMILYLTCITRPDIAYAEY